MSNTSFRLIIIIGVVVAAACSPEAMADSNSATHRQVAQAVEITAKPAAEEKRVVIPVQGMACGSCAKRLQQRLSNIKGVITAMVDFAAKEARVTFDPTKVTVKQLVAEIEKTFEAGKAREGKRS